MIADTGFEECFTESNFELYTRLYSFSFSDIIVSVLGFIFKGCFAFFASSWVFEVVYFFFSSLFRDTVEDGCLLKLVLVFTIAGFNGCFASSFILEAADDDDGALTEI